MGPPVALQRDSVTESSALSEKVGVLVEVKIFALETPPEAADQRPLMVQGATWLAASER